MFPKTERDNSRARGRARQATQRNQPPKPEIDWDARIARLKQIFAELDAKDRRRQ